MTADKIFYNGTIFTGEEDEFAEAVALSGRKIAAVGTKVELMELADEHTELIDLDGRMMMAGFIDSHAHPLLSGVEVLYKVDMNERESADEYIQNIRDFMAENPNQDFIMGAGWINPHFDSKGPRKETLDEICADIPMVFDSGDHHSVWANSKAIQMAGVTAETPDPEGGVIERDENGEPSGTFREAAQDLIHRICPDYTVEQYKKGLEGYQKEMASYGITMSHDAMLTGDSPAHEALIQMDRDDQLLFKMNASFYTDAAAEKHDYNEYVSFMKKSQGKMFTADRVKFFIDGVVEGGTAYLKDEYANQPGYYGESIWDQKVMNDFIADLDKAGMELHFHVIGDKAVDTMLTALENARSVNGERERRPIAAHVQVLDKADISRLVNENVHISANPFWFVKAPGYFDMETERLGEERAEKEYPMKSLFDAGLVVGSASDYSATPVPRPLEGIQLAVTRDFPELGIGDDMVLGREEKISVKEALISFTKNNAILAKMEDVTGTIKAGKLADLVILDSNLFEIDPHQITHTGVYMTISEGRVIYSAEH